MRVRHRLRAAVTLGLVGALAMLGCSALPTAPNVSPLEPVPAALTSPLTQISQPSTSTSIQLTQTVDGSIGGEVTVGRFKIDVPQGAYFGEGDVSISVPDSNVLKVKLDIDGVENKFTVPVRLEIQWGGAFGDNLNPKYLQILWFDEGARVWRFIPSTVDEKKKTIWSDLEHFSEYGVIDAKAGW